MNDPVRPDSQAIFELSRRLTSDVLQPMKSDFVGKDAVIDLMGICLVASENLFILGPPGTAKSALVSELGRRLAGRTFEYLLTRFTEPNELFGPFDIRRLREGELVTNTEGMLPEASLVFLDELLNANSAILNSLLGVLNERVFRRGREKRKLPMLMAIGASNHLPEEDALGALFDRFLVRVHSDNVPADQLGVVLTAGWALAGERPPDHVAFDVEHVRQLNNALLRVDLAEIRPTLVTIVQRLRTAGIAVSDRRAVKLQRLVAASALLSGRMQAMTSDVWVLRHIWDTLEQEEILAAIVQDIMATAAATDADHPRARGDTSPDAEGLARELSAMSTAPADGAYADRLSLLAARCQWVTDARQRDALQTTLDDLWKRLSPAK